MVVHPTITAPSKRLINTAVATVIAARCTIARIIADAVSRQTGAGGIGTAVTTIPATRRSLASGIAIAVRPDSLALIWAACQAKIQPQIS